MENNKIKIGCYDPQNSCFFKLNSVSSIDNYLTSDSIKESDILIFGKYDKQYNDLASSLFFSDGINISLGNTSIESVKNVFEIQERVFQFRDRFPNLIWVYERTAAHLLFGLGIQEVEKIINENLKYNLIIKNEEIEVSYPQNIFFTIPKLEEDNYEVLAYMKTTLKDNTIKQCPAILMYKPLRILITLPNIFKPEEKIHKFIKEKINEYKK